MPPIYNACFLISIMYCVHEADNSSVYSHITSIACELHAINIYLAMLVNYAFKTSLL